MFYSITGKIVYSDQYCVALDCGGVAYKCTVSLNTLSLLPPVGSTATLYTHVVFNQNATAKDDAFEKLGFYDRQELDFFKMLVGVSGVGSKAAISILSTSSPSALAVSIASGDVKAITRAQGVGPKIAQRVVLELKPKMEKLAPSRVSSEQIVGYDQAPAIGNVSEAVSALVSLGFGAADAGEALSKEDPTLSVQALIKIGLKKLSWGG